MEDLFLKQDDIYEIQLASVITNYDEKILFRLYQPIIGYGPVNLYMSLLNEVEGEKIVSTGAKKHIRLFEIMLIDNNKFLKFRKYLEALGLLKTFVLEGENENRYIYRLYAPVMPNRFFAHPILNNLFKRNVSVEEYDRTRLYFINKINVKSTYREVSAHINDLFFNDIKNIKSNDDSNIFNIRERIEGEISSTFDFEAFTVGLKDYQIPKKLLTNAILKEIANYAALYKISAIDMRQVVAQAIDYDEYEKKINLEKLEYFAKLYYDTSIKNVKDNKKNEIKKEVKVTSLPGNTSISKKVQLFNEITPQEFLKIRNNNMEPLSCDLYLLKKLKDNTNLLDPVINVILDYSLEKLEGKLIPNYVERVASSLVRANITDAYEAMLYLNKKKVSYIASNETKTKENISSDEKLNEENKWWE